MVTFYRSGSGSDYLRRWTRMFMHIGHVSHLTYSLLLILAALISLNVLLLALRRRHAPGAREMAFFSFALALWAGIYALHWLNFWQPRPLFWLDLTYLGVVLTPPAFLAFAIAYTDHGQLLSRRLILALAVMPVLTLIFLFTDPWHGLFFGSAPRSTEVGAILEGGVWFWINVSYSYVVMWLAFILLIQAFLRAAPHYRLQLGIVVLGSLIPFATDALMIGGAFNDVPIDLTPVAFSLSGLAYGYAVLRHRWLELSPVARGALVDSMSDGMLVVDNLNRVVDINPAARRILALGAGDVIGRQVESVLAGWRSVLAPYAEARVKQQELQLPGEPARWIELRITPLIDRQARFRGRLAVLRDISERKRIENELQAANQALQERIEQNEALQMLLREQAIRDALTGLFNRRYLDENLDLTLADARRLQEPVSVSLIDLDYFKHFNDHNGHTAGDLLLQMLSELLQSHTRPEDLACRYGGEEFLLLLPGTPAEAALRRINEMRRIFAGLALAYEGRQLQATFSAGVAAFPDHTQDPGELITLADRALYVAKAAGRNRVCLP